MSSTGWTGASTRFSSPRRAFLEHTLRPQHTIFRRIGWIYHSRVRPHEGLARTLGCHSEILDAVLAGQVEAAGLASNRLIAFSDSMFDVLGCGIDPALLDCNLEMLEAS